MRKVLRSTGIFLYRSFEVFCLIVASWLLFAFALPEIQLNGDYVSSTNGVKIFIRSNGVHTDFVMPVRSKMNAWDAGFPPERFSADSSYQYIAMGWGDKGFFLDTPTWGDLTFGTAIIAVSGIGESALHVDYVKDAPKESARVKQFLISEEQYANLIGYILQTMQFRNDGPILIQHAGYGKHDLFFEANGRYSLFTTCNEWTGDGMEAAGLPVGIWTPLEFGIMRR